MDVITGADVVLPVRRLAANGLDAWAQVVGNGYEGYVAKEQASEYRGGLTRAWLKVKVPGWTHPEDRWKRLRLDTPEARLARALGVPVADLLERRCLAPSSSTSVS